MTKEKMVFSLGICLMLVGTSLLTWNVYLFSIGYFAPKKIEIRQTLRHPVADVMTSKKDVPLYIRHPSIGEEIGELIIPRLNQSFPIYHGTDEDTLKMGVGHYPKSVLPGLTNNTVLSAHRDTVFRGLRHVELGDTLTIQSSAGEFTYKVKTIRIVDKNDSTVLVPKPKATLTLTTCYPFYFLGDAKQRYVIVADLIK